VLPSGNPLPSTANQLPQPCGRRSSRPQEDGGPWLHKVAAGGGLALAPPPPRKRTPETEARLAQLQRRFDEKQYADMVADITVEVGWPAVMPCKVHAVMPASLRRLVRLTYISGKLAGGREPAVPSSPWSGLAIVAMGCHSVT